MLSGRLSWAIAPGHSMFLEAGRTALDRTRNVGDSVDPDARRANDGRTLNTREHVTLKYNGTFGNTDADVSLSREWGTRETWGRDAGTGRMEKSDREPEIRNTTLDAKFTTPFQLGGDHTLVFGGQWTENTLTDTNPGALGAPVEEYEVEQWALFVEDEWWITSTFALTGGLRYTDHENYGGEWTPRLYAVWNATDALTIKGGVSKGFKAPGLRQTVDGYYYTTGGGPGRGVMIGDPDLQPETSTSYELSAIYTASSWDVGATLFQTDFRDKIESYSTGVPITVGGIDYESLWEYDNVGKARIRGLELSGSWTATEDLRFRATYTYTDSEQQSGDYEGLPLMRTPENTASLRADWQTPVSGLAAWGTVNYHGREINAGSRIGSNGSVYERNEDGDVIAYEYDPYTTVDLGGSYEFNETVTMNAAIYNVTDERLTSTDNNSVGEGRRLWLGLTAKF